LRAPLVNLNALDAALAPVRMRERAASDKLVAAAISLSGNPSSFGATSRTTARRAARDARAPSGDHGKRSDPGTLRRNASGSDSLLLFELWRGRLSSSVLTTQRAMLLP
jgi:hypothetical protein